jgi:hypothetical protein
MEESKCFFLTKNICAEKDKKREVEEKHET